YPSLRQAVGASWLAGLVFGIIALQWLRIASPPMYFVWIGLALFVSFQFPLFVWLTRRLTGVLGWPLFLAAPVVWTALEFLRAIIGIGFPWYFLAHTQHAYLPMIQIADLAGVYAVSFVVMLANVALYDLLTAWRRGGSEPRVAWGARWSVPLAGLLVAGTLGYGLVRLGQDEFELGPKLALVQGNLEQDIRNDPEAGDQTNRHYLALMEEAARARPDLIVAPETCLEFWWMRIAPDVDPAQVDERFRQGVAVGDEFAQRFGSHWNTPFLIGLTTLIRETQGERRYNGASLIAPPGQEVARYAKCFCIPFGEYIPFEKTLPFMKWLSPYDSDYSVAAGTQLTLFPFGSTPFAVLICYEDTVPHLGRWFMSGATQPAFFVNISNDGWFKGWEEHEQHFAVARFRAVENRRALARSVNMGVSGIIDGNGRVVTLLPGARTLSEGKARPGVVVGQVPLDRRSSLYVLLGDWLPVGCWLLVVLGMAGLVRRGRAAE
ncbi:MAG TPA: apolipoprotein N-acyltransferase, partial [Gemmatales bacterium]|nr:apolipoprotein N-acyltransferase [Gemmatales bacterium]